MADLDAIGVLDGFDPDFFVGVFGDHNKTLAAPREEKSFERIPPGRILILPSDREPRSAYSYVLDNFSMRGQTGEE